MGRFEPTGASNNFESTSNDKEDIRYALQNFSDKAGCGSPCPYEILEDKKNGANFYGNAADASSQSNPLNELPSTSEGKTDIQSSQNFSAETNYELNTDGSPRTGAVVGSPNTENARNNAACVALSAQPSNVRIQPNPSEHQAVDSSLFIKTSDADGWSALLSSNSQSTSGDKDNTPCFSKVFQKQGGSQSNTDTFSQTEAEDSLIEPANFQDYDTHATFTSKPSENLTNLPENKNNTQCFSDGFSIAGASNKVPHSSEGDVGNDVKFANRTAGGVELPKSSDNSQSTSDNQRNAFCFSKTLSTAGYFTPNPDFPCPSEAVKDTKKPANSEDTIQDCTSSQSSDAETVSESTSGDTKNTKISHDAFDIPFFALWQNRWAFFNNTSSLLVLDCKGAQLRLWYDRIASLLKQEQIGPLQTLLFPHIFSLEDRQAAFFTESIDWLKFSKICIARALNDTQFQLEALPQWVPSEQADLFIEQIAASLEYGGQMIAMRYRFEPLLVRLAQRHRFEPVTNEKQVRILCRELQTCENYVTDPLGNHIWNRVDADDLMGKVLP